MKNKNEWTYCIFQVANVDTAKPSLIMYLICFPYNIRLQQLRHDYFFSVLCLGTQSTRLRFIFVGFNTEEVKSHLKQDPSRTQFTSLTFNWSHSLFLSLNIALLLPTLITHGTNANSGDRSKPSLCTSKIQPNVLPLIRVKYQIITVL